MNGKQPKLIVFDLGGVLIRICRSWSEACAAAGLPVRGESASKEVAAKRRELSNRHGLGLVECDEFFQRLAETMDGLYTPQEVRAVHHAWLLGEYPGVGELIRDIRAAGVLTGVLSNTNHTHWNRIMLASGNGSAEHPSARHVDHPHASHLMRLLKPSPEIYAEFERRTGFEGRGGEILFFDDLEDNIAAARAHGWQAELIDHAGDTALEMRRHLIRRGLSIKVPSER